MLTNNKILKPSSLKLVPKGLAGLVSKLAKLFLSKAASSGKKVIRVAKSNATPQSKAPIKNFKVRVNVAQDPKVAFSGVEGIVPEHTGATYTIFKSIPNSNWQTEMKGFNMTLHEANMQMLLHAHNKRSFKGIKFHDLQKPTITGTPEIWKFDPRTATYSNNGRIAFFDGNEWLMVTE